VSSLELRFWFVRFSKRLEGPWPLDLLRSPTEGGLRWPVLVADDSDALEDYGNALASCDSFTWRLRLGHTRLSVVAKASVVLVDVEGRVAL
jgi:hypothetical protein